MNIETKFTPHGFATWCVLLALNILLLQSSRAENLTTLDGQTFTNITEVTKYPKMIVFTYDGNRRTAQNTNLPQDFKDKYKIVVKADAIVTAIPRLTTDTNLPLLEANSDMLECTNDIEPATLITNRYGEHVTRSRTWQMCLQGREVSLLYYNSQRGGKEVMQRLHFFVGQEAIIKQAFEKFIEWNAIATTNNSEPFEKLILACPSPDNIFSVNGSNTYTFRWDPNVYDGAAFYDTSTVEGGFDIDTVTHFKSMLDQIPTLKATVLGKIHNREAQKDLFK